MSIVDDLIANPGLYVGVDRVTRSELVGSARIMVTRLPGGAGVSLDYEVFNPEAPGPILGHSEHTIVARAEGGGTIMAIAHTHGEGLAILRETEEGVFEPGPEAPYPMKVVIAVPKAGELHHEWWYASPGEEAQPRDLAELTLIT